MNRSAWRRPLTVLLSLGAVVIGAGAAAAEDLVEFLNGAKVTGKVLQIRKADKEFDFEVQIGGRGVKRTYPYVKVHAVTINGRRFVINEMSETPEGSTSDRGSSRPVRRSKAEVLRLVEQAGGEPPYWLADTQVDAPASLDLSWPLKPPGKGWNNQKNVGQYLWDVINPNPARWKSGLKLVAEMQDRHRGDATLLNRDYNALGGMYFRLFQDYPRAAFWLGKGSGKRKGTLESCLLAECYWRMGCQPLALELLDTTTIHPQAIKLLGDMGRTDRACQLAEGLARAGQPHQAFLLAGDAARLAGDYRRAERYYQRVIDSPDARNEDYQQRFAGRARESIEAMRLFDRADPAKVADGAHRGAATGYNGQLRVEVTVAGGRVTDIQVQHQEKQFYSAITDTVGQIIDKQSVTKIDGTSRATITSQAIVNATARALASGAATP